MKTYFGTYYQTHGGQAEEASVLVFDKKISIGYRAAAGNTITVQWPVKELEVSFDYPTQSTRIKYKDQPVAELLIGGREAGEYIRELQDELQKPWYRKSGAKEWSRNLSLLVGVLGVLVLLYLLFVPWLSEKLASRVSVKTEEQLGESVYGAMGLSAREDSAHSLLLNEFFAAMEVPSAYRIKITVINENVVNAFALPGGRIVVYSALLKQIKSYPELAALLSHEFTHVNNKHATKSIFRQLGSKVFLGLLFGRFGSVTNVLIDHADNLKSLRYSRKLEKEADMEGLGLLMQRKIDPRGFADLFHHMKAAAPANSLPEILESHPDIDKRVAYIKKAAGHAVVEEDALLKTIFEQIK